MNLNKQLALGLAAAALLAAGAWRLAHRENAANAAVAATGSPASAQAALELAGTDLLTLQAHPLSREVVVTGSLKAVNSAVLRAKVAGELLSLGPREGDRVQAGQVIGRIDSSEFDSRLRQAQQQAEAARAQLDVAQRQLDNNRALVNQGYISATALDTSVANANGARATLQAAQAAVELAQKALNDAVLRAPLGGIVSQRLVQPGERVAIDARLLEIVDLSQLELEAALAPDEAGAVRLGAPAVLQVEGISSPVPARVVRINPSTQSGTRAVLAYLSVDTRARPAAIEGLRAGLFARGQIELGREQALTLPASAVRLDESKPYVIALEGERLRHRTVELGARGRLAGAAESQGSGTGEQVAIRSGLAAGARVLAGSVGTVRDGAPARLAPQASPAAPSQASQPGAAAH
jgi:membrane fusion protein (multidrug efflux system)